MTKSITDLARQFADLTTDARGRETFSFDNYGLELLKTAIIESLAGEMPEPVAWRCTNWSGSIDDYIYRDADDCAVNAKGEKCGEPLYTANQLREYAAGLVAKAVAAEREQCAKVCEKQWTERWGTASECADAIRARGNV